MYTKILLEYALIVELTMSVALLLLMWRKRLVAEFTAVFALLTARAMIDSIAIALLFFRKAMGISLVHAYKAYCYSVWTSSALQAILTILVIYSVYRSAMKPLVGLQSIGKVIFRWVAGVSVALSIGLAIGPHLLATGYAATVEVSSVYAQIQQATSVLILCLLLFVCFATRPLGLTFRSHIFGVTLGLGVTAVFNLIESAWFSTSGAHSVYSPIYLVSVLGYCTAQVVWLTYFALPEPERKMVLLPTTSPFFFWNRVSEALGDNPGYVAVSGFRPEMLAPAELKVLRAASASAHQRHREAAQRPHPDPVAAPLPTVAFRH